MGSQQNVLIIDADLSLKTLLSAIVRSIDQDIEPEWAETPDAAKKALASGRKYKLVISDYELPGQASGLDMWEHARRALPDVPFLLLSSVAIDEFLQGLQKEGLQKDLYPPILKKPFDIVVCRNMVAKLLAEVAGV